MPEVVVIDTTNINIISEPEVIAVYTETPKEIIVIYTGMENSVANPGLYTLDTTDNSWHTIRSWTTVSGKTYIIEGIIIARQTNNASGNLGKSFSSKGFCGFHNIAGVLTAIGAATFFGQQSDIPLASVRFNVNTTNIELQVNGGNAATDISWDLLSSIFTKV